MFDCKICNPFSQNTNFILSHFSNCESCGKLFHTKQGLRNHQSRDTGNNYACHRLQIISQRKIVQDEKKERKQNTASHKLQNYHADVSAGSHSKGSPLTAKEKVCIVNLYQSYANEGMPLKDAKDQVVKRLGIGERSVANTIKEMLENGTLEDNKNVKMKPNAYEKLAQEEIDDIRKIVHEHMRACDVKRMTEGAEGMCT